MFHQASLIVCQKHILVHNILKSNCISISEKKKSLSFSTDSGLIAGVTSPIISSFVILVVGSIAAYTAYKNKKLCFKPQGKTEFVSSFPSRFSTGADGNFTNNFSGGRNRSGMKHLKILS